MDQLNPLFRLLVRRREIDGEQSMLASEVIVRNPDTLVAHEAGFEVYRDRHGGVDEYSGAGQRIRLYDPQLLRYVTLLAEEPEEALRARVGGILGPVMVLREENIYIVAHTLADPLVPQLVGQGRRVNLDDFDLGRSPGSQFVVKGWFQPLCAPMKSVATPRGYAGAKEINAADRSW